MPSFRKRQQKVTKIVAEQGKSMEMKESLPQRKTTTLQVEVRRRNYRYPKKLLEWSNEVLPLRYVISTGDGWEGGGVAGGSP